MGPRVYWVKERGYPPLGIMPRPCGGDWLGEEIVSLTQEGVDVLVSLLTPEEDEELELQKEAELCAQNGLEFISFPIPDRDVPPRDGNSARFFRTLLDRLAEGKHVTIHCRAGIGRSSLVAACLLTAYEIPVEDAISALSSARGWPVPDTTEQLRWIAEFAKLYSADSEP
ncbi:MAG: dual specificity protein phosphatase family protein [Acidobacteriia bacterium]|nr:dual specificity protein phosphatase family protein [Terriglobia bacterium]